MCKRSLQRLAAGALTLLVPGLLSPGLMQPATAQEGRKAVNVAAVDFIPAWGDLEDKSRRLAQAAQRLPAQGVDDAVFPETAISGYDFTEPAQLAPYVDTIPRRATAALLPVLRRTGLIMSVGIAERDAITGIFYNTAVLMGPEGIIGKYRKNGLNGQDVQLFGPGDTDGGVFDTPIGRITLIIFCDDTYWQYDRLAALRGAQIPQLVGLHQTLRTDVLAALKVEIDPRLYAVSVPPTGRADLHPYLAAKLGQFWVVSGGRRVGGATATGIYGPEPVVFTPTLTAAAEADAVRHRTVLPAPDTWINQRQLMIGR